ncbi:MAG: substrate-binding domain-containing protein [Ruminococcus sp.]
MQRNHKGKYRFKILLPVIMLLAGCSSQTEQSLESVAGLEQLGEIQVIAREEGSGTRDAFASLLDFAQNSSSDLTTETAQIAENAEAVIAAVSKNPSAVGYVSLGSLDETESVKILKLNGVSPDEKSYALSRSFYLAYHGKQNALEQDFLTYVQGAGQEIVAKSYTPVAKSSSFLSNQADGTILLSGSTSVAPLMEELASSYMEINPHAAIQVEQSDSTQGLNAAMSGICNFGMASRDLKDYEAELLDYTIIAQDNIAVIVHPENPVENLTPEILKEIYTGNLKNWEEINTCAKE